MPAPNNTSTTKKAIDPTDFQYQADKLFPPDKECKWSYDKERDGWMHAHNAIRAELKVIEECFDAVNKQACSSPKLLQWQVASFQKIFDSHYQFVHEHHHNEDGILTPQLNKRINYPAKLTDDHDGIVKQLETLKKLVTGLKPGDDSEASMKALLGEWKNYSSHLREHLQEEEDVGLPLMRAYFLPDEYAKITEEIIKGAPKLELGSFIYTMGKDRFRSEFMVQERIPFFVWYLVFGGALTLYEKEFVAHTDAIKAGEEPVPKSSNWLGC